MRAAKRRQLDEITGRVGMELAIQRERRIQRVLLAVAAVIGAGLLLWTCERDAAAEPSRFTPGLSGASQVGSVPDGRGDAMEGAPPRRMKALGPEPGRASATRTQAAGSGPQDGTRGVERWRDECVHWLRVYGALTDENVALALRIIARESNGDPDAHTPGSQYYGICQFGTGWVDDGDLYVAPADRGTARDWRMDPETSIRLMCKCIAEGSVYRQFSTAR